MSAPAEGSLPRPLVNAAAALAPVLAVLLLIDRLQGYRKCSLLTRHGSLEVGEPSAPGTPSDPPGVPPWPSLDVYKRLQALNLSSSDPIDPGVADEFAAAPWLLPCRTAALPYAGIHGFDALLSQQSAAAGPHNKSIALMLFNAAHAVFAQNTVYSLVKLGGVRNYMMLTWTSADLAACADLNLPCADASAMLLRPGKGVAQAGAALIGSPEFRAINWLKPAAMLQAAQQGYAVLMIDTDISFTAKPVWDSLMACTQRAAADGAWQFEAGGAVGNTGFVFVRPTPGGLAYLRAWNASGPAMLAQGLSEQNAQARIKGKSFLGCHSPCGCHRVHNELTKQRKRGQMAIMHTFLSSVTHYSNSPEWGQCMLGGDPLWMIRPDPCDWKVLFLHPICIGTYARLRKRTALQVTGFWFMDTDASGNCAHQPGSASRVAACRPLQWRAPGTEAPHYACPSPGLGLVHGGEPQALAALAAGTMQYEGGGNKSAEEALVRSFGVGPC